MQSMSTVTATLLATCIALLGSAAQAQVYRSVGPDGKVVFSDRPNSATSPALSKGGTESSDASSSGSTALPYELRQAASRYPVTLYSSKDCQPCDDARSYLRGRGIPFSERLVETASDFEAFKKLSSQEMLPFATVGQQYLKGFASDRWAQYLNAAGYPAQSQLPKSYQAPAARPLTTPAPDTPEKKAADQRPAPRASETAPVAPGTPTRDNPAGLRF